MANELTVSSLGDAVRERVKLAIFSSIPDEAVDKLIKNEFQRMVTEKSDYFDSKNVSPLHRMIGDEIKRQLSDRSKQAVSEYLDKTYQAQPKQMVDAAIKELAPLFMAGMVESFTTAAINSLRSQLYNKGIQL